MIRLEASWNFSATGLLEWRTDNFDENNCQSYVHWNQQCQHFRLHTMFVHSEDASYFCKSLSEYFASSVIRKRSRLDRVTMAFVYPLDVITVQSKLLFIVFNFLIPLLKKWCVVEYFYTGRSNFHVRRLVQCGLFIFINKNVHHLSSAHDSMTSACAHELVTSDIVCIWTNCMYYSVYVN